MCLLSSHQGVATDKSLQICHGGCPLPKECLTHSVGTPPSPAALTPHTHEHRRGFSMCEQTRTQWHPAQPASPTASSPSQVHSPPRVSVPQPTSSVSPQQGGLTHLPLAVSWSLSSWGRAAQPPAFPHRCLSEQQVRPDYWGVCWRLHPDAANPNMPATPQCWLQKAGARTQQEEDAGSWEGKERGEMLQEKGCSGLKG